MNFSAALLQSTSMPSSWFISAFIKNFIVVFLGCTINYVNAMLVFTFFRHHEFRYDPRYVLYIHMVFNDIIQLTVTVILHVSNYLGPVVNAIACCILLLLASFTSMNTPLNLAGMAVERYIAICDPLRHAQICTLRRTYVLIVLIWAVGSIPGLATLTMGVLARSRSFFRSNILCYLQNIFNSPSSLLSKYITHSLYMSFVWLMLIYTYIRVLCAAKSVSSDTGSARKARNTILLHGAQLLLCMLSYIIPSLDMLLISYFPKHRSHIMFTNYIIAFMLPRFLSPIIYGIREPNFKKHIGRYLLCGLAAARVEPRGKR